MVVGSGWEVFEVIMLPSMPWLYETLGNKARDFVMELLGFATGIVMVYEFGYPYRMGGESLWVALRSPGSEKGGSLNHFPIAPMK